MINLMGKVAIVTGGASGIGRACVLRMVEAGATVHFGDMDEVGGAETVSLAATGSATFHPLDVTDRDQIERFATEVAASPAVDIIVNVAGWDRVQPFLDATPEFMDQILEINLKGPMNVVKAFLPAMMEAQQQGKIVNISSDAGRVGSLGETIYAGAKGGVIAFTKSLARETARAGICVNCVCPGPTDTPLLRMQPQSIQEKLARAVPFRRVAQPQEIADAVLFFSSDLAGYVTGQVLSVSGGLTMSG